MKNKVQESLVVPREVFEMLENYIEKEGMFNPYKIQTEEGRFMDLYIEDIYTDKD